MGIDANPQPADQASPPSPPRPSHSSALYNPTGHESPNRRNLTILQSMHPCLVVFIIFAFIFYLVSLIATPNPFFSLLFTVLALIPALYIAHFLRRHLHDDAVPNSFLISQFFLAAIPLSIAIIVVEVMMFGLLVVVFLRSSLDKLTDALENLHANDVSDEQAAQVLQDLIKEIPLWKFVVLAICMAFVVAAITEETGKWIIARRYRAVNNLPENNEDSQRRIGVHGILAVASAAALGFATAENLLFVLGLSRYTSNSIFPFRRVGLTLLRDIMAFPVHVGATFYVALAAAQRSVFSDGMGVFSALLVAVFFHGSFDAVAIVASLLVALEKVQSWVEIAVIFVQLTLVCLLLLLCRNKFRAIMERDRAACAEAAMYSDV